MQQVPVHYNLFEGGLHVYIMHVLIASGWVFTPAL